MDKARHKRNYDLHSWSGVSLGIFLFIVCFTGSVAVFSLSETHAWEDPANRLSFSGEPKPVTDTFNAWLNEQAQLGDVEFVSMRWPSNAHPYYTAYADVHLDMTDEHEWIEQRWHPETLAPVETRQASMSRWLVDFHIYLKWPTMLGGYTVGAFLVGLAGILLLLSILTGIIAHTKLKEEAFSLRLDKSVRLRWQDSHKVIGLWGAPFHAMIGFTGAFLGIIATLTPVMAFLAFQGNTAALFEAFEGQNRAASGISAQMISLEDARKFKILESELPAQSIVIQNYGDEGASYTLYWEPTERLAYGQLKISAVTGETLPLDPLNETDTAIKRVSAAISPLHFGTFGGVALKFVWFFLGLSLSVITALGTMMWIERRKYGNVGHRSDMFYDRLSKLNVGVCTGLAVGTAALFVHNVVYWGDEADRGLSIAWCYLGAWAAAIAYAFLRDGAYKANRELVAITGTLLVLAAILNQILTELPAAGIGTHIRTLLTDLTLAVFGISAIAIAKMLPRKRSEKRRVGLEAKTELLDDEVPAPAE